jgi:regulator of replication initiation timing
MSIIADIEKLITEHGSAAILREKVGLLELQRGSATSERDKALSEVSSLKKQIESLESDNANLKIELQKARDEIERLKQPKSPGVSWGSQPRIKGRMG